MAKSCENLGHGPKLTTETINPIQCSSILHLLYAGRNCAMCQNIIRSHKAQIRVVKYWERRFVRWILNSFLEYIQRRLHGSMQWVRNSCFKENRPPKQAQIPNITHWSKIKILSVTNSSSFLFVCFPFFPKVDHSEVSLVGFRKLTFIFNMSYFFQMMIPEVTCE